MAEAKYYYGIGRRKEAIVTARLYKGKGEITVGSKSAQEYFGHTSLLERILQPLIMIQQQNDFNISLKVKGGGISGQADATRLAVSKAVITMSEDLRPTLKRAGYLKRDARVKERKKYGLKRARKAPQFTKH